MVNGPLSSAEEPAERIDGRAVAARVVDRVAAATQRLKTEAGVVPGLAVVLVGDDPASQVYVGAKGKKATELGFHSVQHTLPTGTTEAELLELVGRLNDDLDIHGILVQLPLPDLIDKNRVIEAISPEKDVDGFHPINVGRLASGAGNAMVPCTPAGCLILLRDTLGDRLAGLDAVVIGRSNLVGKPIAQLLLGENCTVTIAHSRTRDLPSVVRSGDVVVAAVGRPEMIRGDWIKPGATVIDVGVNRVPAPERGAGKTRLVGDVAFAEAARVAAAITPVPGGVGPMTIAMLMANTLTAAYRRVGRTPPDMS
ncbi:MAG: bifunctional methylenetetrahydrofolate dehydrogenase/methenyltetrahydrofolate cyclohydrolase FolD [Hyphomicrobiales bacterium]|nr:bifunctional methylenetetrahydrofolate dehydrogenase/methenyltetrahydrofolate cyclohydrolase FolD [Hyphomicrobiales bacterium]